MNSLHLTASWPCTLYRLIRTHQNRYDQDFDLFAYCKDVWSDQDPPFRSDLFPCQVIALRQLVDVSFLTEPDKSHIFQTIVPCRSQHFAYSLRDGNINLTNDMLFFHHVATCTSYSFPECLLVSLFIFDLNYIVPLFTKIRRFI